MKILNFGSLNIDYVYSVEHFVRPGETLAASKRDIFAGGKGLNQSIALARANSKVSSEILQKYPLIKNEELTQIWHAGAIGKTESQFLKELLSSTGIITDYILETDEPSGHAVIQVDARGQNSILLYGGANRSIGPCFIDEVLSHFAPGDFLLLQNEINNISYLLEKAHEKGLIIFFNPSPYDLHIKKLPLEYVHYFLVNEIEAAEIAGMADFIATDNISNNSDFKSVIESIMDSLTSQFPKSKIILTLGKNGVSYFDGSKIYYHGIYKIPVVDTTAAGDTFTGYFINLLSRNLSPDKY